MEQFEGQRAILLDGGFATQLEELGMDLNDELWSAKALIDSPELVMDVHTRYLDAGADIITTASYQASVRGFAERGIPRERALELMTLSVRIAKKARDAFWSGWSRTHSGAVLHGGEEYTGAYRLTEDEYCDFHRDRMCALIDGGPDLLAIETFPQLEEARCVVGLLEREFPKQRAWVSFSCKDEEHVVNGDLLVECLRFVDHSPSVVAVGVNCTAPCHVEGLVSRLAALSCKRLIVYPNSGEGWDSSAGSWTPATGDEGDPSVLVHTWIEAGASIIGGCCRTTPATITALRAAAMRCMPN